MCVIVPVPAKFGCNKTQRTHIVMLNCVCELFTSHNVRDTMHAVYIRFCLHVNGRASPFTLILCLVKAVLFKECLLGYFIHTYCCRLSQFKDFQIGLKNTQLKL